jgi:CRISPR system Cascade subunit CasD
MSIISIRWAGPVMSIAGPRIDAYASSQPIPSPSMVAGLIGAALGIRRGDDTLLAIRRGVRYAVVVHRDGVESIDYQTADLTTPHMIGPMWWRDGTGRVGTMDRLGGGSETAEQWRPLRHDADMTLVVEILAGSPYTAQQILEALDAPVFPLYLGRSHCTPGCRMAGRVLEAEDLVAASEQVGEGRVYLPSEATDPLLGDLIAEVVSRDGEIARYVVR